MFPLGFPFSQVKQVPSKKTYTHLGHLGMPFRGYPFVFKKKQLQGNPRRQTKILRVPLFSCWCSVGNKLPGVDKPRTSLKRNQIGEDFCCSGSFHFSFPAYSKQQALTHTHTQQFHDSRLASDGASLDTLRLLGDGDDLLADVLVRVERSGTGRG